MEFTQGSVELFRAIREDNVDYLKTQSTPDTLHTMFDPINRSSRPARTTALEYACAFRSYKCVDYIIQMGVTLDEVIISSDHGETTVLYLCAVWRQLKLVEILLKAGADPNLCNPLERMRCRNFPEEMDVARTLIRYGADGSSLPEDHPLKGMWRERCALHNQVAYLCTMANRPPYGRSVHANILRHIGKHLWSMR